ncbi:MAG TPA: class I SAM-dependent methyltransferase [Candidatus Limnocylindrales bacterium]|nr:class I SAM-dependent methyltransferase [Candidatus Limnocylindrales bacterium]
MSDAPSFDEPHPPAQDESTDPMFAPEIVGPTVDLLSELARGGRALELGIGTGRVALPLAARGIDVAGIDQSETAARRLQATPGGERIPVTIGDFATTRVEGTFSLVYLVYNTIMNLTTQAAQVDCFRNAAAHLGRGGVFLIETMIPDLRRLPPGDRFVPFDVSDGHVGIDEYDVASQGLVSHHFERVGGGWNRSSGPFRYVWPSELDLMARIAGMRLRDRWAGWRREPFTSESRSHISVWEKPTGRIGDHPGELGGVPT